MDSPTLCLCRRGRSRLLPTSRAISAQSTFTTRLTVSATRPAVVAWGQMREALARDADAPCSLDDERQS